MFRGWQEVYSSDAPSIREKIECLSHSKWKKNSHFMQGTSKGREKTVEAGELAVIMPVYNEEEIIEKVVGKWVSQLDRLGIDYQFHVYNDGSRDRTWEILLRLVVELKRIVLHNQTNHGHGPTILKGYRENSKCQWIFQVDSDDEIGPELFEEIWIGRKKYDLLLGRRIRKRQPFSRKIVSFISQIVTWSLFGKRVFDVNSPYRLMKAEKFRNLFDHLPNDAFAPNLILSGIAAMNGFAIREIPVQQKERETGEVSIRNMKMIQAAFKTFRQTLLYRFGKSNQSSNRYFGSER